MEGNYLSRIKLNAIDLLVRQAETNPRLNLVIEKLFVIFAGEPANLSKLIDSLSHTALDYREQVARCLQSKHPAIRRQSILYLAERKIPGYTEEFLVSYPEEPPEIKLAFVEYFQFSFTHQEVPYVINFLEIEKDPCIRSLMIKLLSRFLDNRETFKFFQMLRQSLSDEREWFEYVEVLRQRKDWRTLMQLPRDLPVVVRIMICSALVQIKDFKTREFLWDRFSREEEIPRIALLKSLPVDTDIEAQQIKEAVENMNHVLHRKLISILAEREENCLVVFITRWLIDEIRRKIVTLIRKVNTDLILKSLTRFYRSRSEKERKNLHQQIADSPLKAEEQKFLIYFLDNHFSQISDNLLHELEKSTYINDLREYPDSPFFYLWLSFLMIRDALPFDLICPFVDLPECTNRQEIICYGVRKNEKKGLALMFDLIENREKERPAAIRMMTGNLDPVTRKFLISHFSSLDSCSKIAALELFSRETNDLIPLLRLSLEDKHHEVRLKAAELLMFLPDDLEREFMKPMLKSGNPELLLAAANHYQGRTEEEFKIRILQALCVIPELELLKLFSTALLELFSDFPLFFYSLVGFELQDISDQLSVKFKLAWQNEKNWAELLALFNDELFFREIGNPAEAFFFCLIIYCFKSRIDLDALKIWETPGVSEDFLAKIKHELESEKKQILIRGVLDLLEGGIKQSYFWRLYCWEFEIPPTSELQEFARAYPANRQALLLMIGETYFAEGDYQQTISFLQRLQDGEIKDAKILFQIGYSYIRLGHLSLGMPYLDRLDKLTHVTDHKEYLYIVGEELEKKREWRSALHFFKKIAEVDLGYRDLSQRLISLQKKIEVVSEKSYPFDMERFVEIEEIGSGGMGRVYKAHDLKNNRSVAVKILSREHLGNQKIARRFIYRDGLVTQKLNHPGIVKIYEVFKDSVPPYIVMEYLEGSNLHDLIKSGPLTEEQLKKIFKGILDAISFAHSQGIIHRDLKPDNIMVNFQDCIKLMDFGLAKEAGATTLTQAGETFGTLYYMPPEQIRGIDVDERADIYALGVILYEMLTGGLPFCGENPEATMYKIFKEQPKAPSETAPRLEKWNLLIQKALEKKPEDRYQGVSELLIAFEKVD
ncbi:MAG: serine/threonine-protein kinase [Candidatus Wallbacteria bacterium]|nr:serine/threonine-protein kinase [Candidatus Wallbacteria bacterium]